MVKRLSVYSNKGIKINKKNVHQTVADLQKELGFTVDSLQINFVNAEQITEINKEYLQHQGSTDIITFNYSGDIKNLEGELFISTDDADYNAKKFSVDFSKELLRLIIHGILHLIGYEDDIPEHKKKMKYLENKFVNSFSKFEDKYRII